jgi:thiamine biosynthesis lipoprotein ApbE
MTSADARPTRTVRVEAVMGTVVSIDIRPPLVEPSAIDAAITSFHNIDERFSTYKPTSEISRLARGELREADCSALVQHVLTICAGMRGDTKGAFDVWHCAADGGLAQTLCKTVQLDPRVNTLIHEKRAGTLPAL